MASGNAGSIRVDSLDKAGLKTMENHERRLDRTGARRSVRKDAEGKPMPPLIYDPYATGTGKDCLVDALAKHVEGAKINKAAENVTRHAFVQWPVALEVTPETEKMMLDKAVEFVNKTHGGNAVFRARLDRDELGRHGVDVFFAPVYEKTTKRGSTKWVSLTKFGKGLAVERFGQKPKTVASKNEDTGEVTWEPVLDASGDPVMVDCDSKWHQGRALQDEWFEFLRDDVGLDWVVRGDPKIGSDPDRLEPEAFGLRKDLERLHSSNLDTLEKLERDLTAEIAERETKLLKREAEIERERNRALKEIDDRSAEVTKAVEEAEKRVAALDAREKELEEREATVAKAEKDQAKAREWFATLAQNLRAGISLAMSGQHRNVVTADDFDTEAQFNAIRCAATAEGKQPTRGFRARFWTLFYSGDGTPHPYFDEATRKGIATTFDQIDKFADAQQRLQKREQAVQKREEAIQRAEEKLEPLRASVKALEARRVVLEAEIEGKENYLADVEVNVEAVTENLERLSALGTSERIEQLEANFRGLHWAVETILKKAGLDENRPWVGYKDPNGNPPPLLELVFDVGKRKAREMVQALARARSGPAGPGGS